ncbi:MAG: DUF4145 domain-containing protein [Verrucomicrobia bacterium]|nr:MAG: DUF4145 domain-containing protein [Verrucomicrobiota bacterium]
MQQPFTPPTFRSTAFHCPHCNAYANQLWFEAYISHGGWKGVENTSFCRCAHCNEYSVWISGGMIYPGSSSAPLPNPDLPEEIKTDYEEARAIISRSPRGACALLRLCVQKLCGFLGESGKDVNADIAALVKKGLNPKIQKSLDIVRVIGNEAVHPGQIDLRDQPTTATQLCSLLNVIADAMITQPKVIESLYAGLPETKLQQIEKRDKPKGT